MAREYFNDTIDLVECLSFHGLVDQLLDGSADKGVMAIENSIAGSIIPNYALVYQNNLHIIGEHYLNIHHNLMVLKGRKLNDIKEVRSHPMALLQCREYLKTQPHIKMVEDVDTAETAKRIQDQQLKDIRFITDHKRGSLAAVLNVMSDCNLNLTKIQSLPIIETPWKYAFFVDITFETYDHFDKAKSLLNIMSEEFKVLGEYKNARL